MDGDWQEWRHLDELRELFGEKGWKLGVLRRVEPPFVFAESGAYRISCHHRDPGSGERLCEVSETREGEECRAVLVWGIPTPGQARGLLERYGLRAEDEPQPGARGSWASILPPVVHLGESSREGS